MRLGSVCSGIGGAELAFQGLVSHSFMSEIEPFPRAVLSHHFPSVPRHGDFTTIKKGDYDPIDILAGGTPCQSFSIAGLRTGMADERGNLALEYLRLADRLRGWGQFCSKSCKARDQERRTGQNANYHARRIHRESL